MTPLEAGWFGLTIACRTKCQYPLATIISYSTYVLQKPNRWLRSKKDSVGIRFDLDHVTVRHSEVLAVLEIGETQFLVFDDVKEQQILQM